MAQTSHRQQSYSPSSKAKRNAISHQMPEYMIRNPSYVLRDENDNLFQRGEQKKLNPPINELPAGGKQIKANQRFGISKDSPFDSAYTQFHSSTKAIYNGVQWIKDNAHKLTNIYQNKTVNGCPRPFAELSKSSMTQENQRKVMLHFNKEARMKLLSGAHKRLLNERKELEQQNAYRSQMGKSSSFRKPT